MKKNNPNSQVSSKHRVITMLDRAEMDFLDKIGKDALFSTGHKLSYNEILKSLVGLARDMKLSGEKIDSPDALKDKLLRQIAEEIAKEKLKYVYVGNA